MAQTNLNLIYKIKKFKQENNQILYKVKELKKQNIWINYKISKFETLKVLHTIKEIEEPILDNFNGWGTDSYNGNCSIENNILKIEISSDGYCVKYPEEEKRYKKISFFYKTETTEETAQILIETANGYEYLPQSEDWRYYEKNAEEDFLEYIGFVNEEGGYTGEVQKAYIKEFYVEKISEELKAGLYMGYKIKIFLTNQQFLEYKIKNFLTQNKKVYYRLGRDYKAMGKRIVFKGFEE